jgi:hypothetical protein
MSPDLLLWLAFTLKITVTAGFVVVCSLIAERAGALAGALVVTLPASAGPAYVLLAMDHNASFVAGAAVGGLAVVSVKTVFCLAYAAVAQRHGIAASFAAAFATWIVLVVLAGSLTWTFAGVIMLTLVTFGLCVPLAERFCHGAIPPGEHRWYDVLLRVQLVCTLWRWLSARAPNSGPYRPVPDCAIEHGPHPALSHQRCCNGCSDGKRHTGVSRFRNRAGIAGLDRRAARHSASALSHIAGKRCMEHCLVERATPRAAPRRKRHARISSIAAKRPALGRTPSYTTIGRI